MAAAVVQRVERIESLRQLAPAGRARTEAELRAGLNDVEAVRSWAAAAEAHIVGQLAAITPIPEASIAGATRNSINAASKTRERSATLDSAVGFDDALITGSIVTGHVDELTKAAKKLDDAAQRDELFGRAEQLLADAERSTIAQFRVTLAREVKSIQRDDGMERLDRQRRMTSMSTWVDDDGMWNLRAKFDPVSGIELSNIIDRNLKVLFAEQTPESCPTDPVEKQKHLAALALHRLISGDERAVRRGGGETLAVIDADQPNSSSGSGSGSGHAAIDWGIPVEVPTRVLAELVESGATNVVGVVVRNGVIIHAPGEMNLGRSSRHASRDQRRALRAMYRKCAIPGCSTHFDHCKIHHIIWWSNGGLTDLHNLLPVCVHHHHQIHDVGWQIELGPNRELTLTLPGGHKMSTGPPTRQAA